MKKPVKLIPNELVINTFRYTLVCRGDRSLIFEQKVSKISSNLEVWMKIIFNNKELIPTDEDFGLTACTFYTKKEAEKRMKELEEGTFCRPSSYYDDI